MCVCTQTDLLLSDWERVKLCGHFEQTFAGVRIAESLVWMHSTTLGDLYATVVAQLRALGQTVPLELSTDDDEYARSAAVANGAAEALLFSGQGAQYVGMCVQLCQESERARQLFARASEIVGFDVLARCRDGPLPQLSETSVCQIAILVADVAALEKVPEAQKRRVKACAGLSLGEYAALVFADVLTFDDAVRIVHARAQAMQAASDAAPTGLASVLGLGDAALQALLDECNAKAESSQQLLAVANYLAPGNRAVGGSSAALDVLAELAAKHNAKKVTRLNVSGAFHSAHMQPAQAALAAAVEAAEWRAPRVAVISNVSARAYESVDEIKAALVRHIVEPVRWQQSIELMLGEFGVTTFVELGCGTILTGLLRHILRARNGNGAAPTNVELCSVSV
jgi:[acyl-carrier-protein] S-malonyltransferase